MTYEIDIAGLKRDLPLCKVTDDLYIGAFVMFGDVEVTGNSGKIKTMSDDVTVGGSVSGDVSTMSGDIEHH